MRQAKGRKFAAVRAALVRHHRPAGRRQDDGADECGAGRSRWRANWARAPSPGSAARGCASGGSPTSAVLIDTAGRYTTQDSNQAVDRAGWQAFLPCCKRTRPEQPLNGMLVAIALDDSPASPAAGGGACAAPSARRIDELDRRVRLAAAGLCAADQGGPAGRASPSSSTIWTVPAASRSGAPPCPLGAGVSAARVRPAAGPAEPAPVFSGWTPRADPERRALIAGFPAQFASVLPALQAFMARAFAADADGRSPLLRGVFLTSGTQEGTPIDRLTGGLSRAFGLDQRRAAKLRPEAGRAYFLADLLRTWCSAEAHAGGVPARRRPPAQAARLGAFVALHGGRPGRQCRFAGPAFARRLPRSRPPMRPWPSRRRAARAVTLDPVADSDFASAAAAARRGASRRRLGPRADRSAGIRAG